MEFFSRKDAADRKMKHYFSGRPCLKNHIAPRYVSTGNCLQCAREYQMRWKRECINPFKPRFITVKYRTDACRKAIEDVAELLWIQSEPSPVDINAELTRLYGPEVLRLTGRTPTPGVIKDPKIQAFDDAIREAEDKRLAPYGSHNPPPYKP